MNNVSQLFKDNNFNLDLEIKAAEADVKIAKGNYDAACGFYEKASAVWLKTNIFAGLKNASDLQELARCKYATALANLELLRS